MHGEVIRVSGSSSYPRWVTSAFSQPRHVVPFRNVHVGINCQAVMATPALGWWEREHAYPHMAMSSGFPSIWVLRLEEGVENYLWNKLEIPNPGYIRFFSSRIIYSFHSKSFIIFASDFFSIDHADQNGKHGFDLSS